MVFEEEQERGSERRGRGGIWRKEETEIYGVC